jgi:hypothetical protein
LEAETANGSLITSFDVPVTVDLHYTEEELAEHHIDEETLTAMFWSNDQVPPGYDTSGISVNRFPEENKLSFDTDHFTEFVLMGKPIGMQIPLEQAGWNLKGYPFPGTTPITEALRSIDGFYDIVYDYRETETNPAQMWKRYIVGLPDEFNTLTELRGGEGYWIHATEPVTWEIPLPVSTLLEATVAANVQPPSAYYGTVQAGEDFVPTVGMVVEARVGNQVCGQSNLREVDGQLMYVVDVNAADANVACGTQGAEVTFSVGGQELPVTAVWDNNRLRQLDLSTTQQIYLPVVKR